MLIQKGMNLKFWQLFCLALLLFVTLCMLFACQPDRSWDPLVDPALLTPSRTSSAAQLATPAVATSLISTTTTTAATEQLLIQTNVPASDLRDLAVRLRPGVAEVPVVVNSTMPDYTVGDQLHFWVQNVNTQATKQITAELIYKPAVAYVWVEVGPSYNRTAILQTVDQFSTHSYPTEVAVFGSEWKPGVDNDPRLHLLYTTGLGTPAGYYSEANEYSRLVNPYSNEKEMLYISLAELGDGGVLAHEFQHMIHQHHDSNEATWVDEGLSEYAKEVAGFGTSDSVGDFLNQPDTPLTAWEEGTRNHYGASYLFMKYLQQRFGPALLSTLVAQPANGVAGLQQAFAQQGILQEFDALFADWVVANYANQPKALGQEGLYGYPAFQFGKPSTTHLNAQYPVTSYQATVNNYATDYIRLQGEGKVTIQFAGQTTTQLAAPPAFSGRYAWWSNQGDRSDSRLTRRFDLQSVAPGTPFALEVTMWWDIEEHYDYGYVLASRDGRKWDILPGQQTTTDNPLGNSFGPAYTGQPLPSAKTATRWVVEHFDLSRYAGEQIWVRFEYITDDAVNYTGWFIDDIRIPLINYATDFEHGADGWESDGWLLSDNHLTQRWLLQVLEFKGDALVNLRRVKVDANGRAQIEVTQLSDTHYAVLAISALAPATTVPGQYELEIR